MKKIIRTAIAAALAVISSACTGELRQVSQLAAVKTINVSIEGTIDGYSQQEDTKITAQPVIRILWQGGEKVYAYEGSKYLGYLTASIEGTDGSYAKLSGTITAPSEGKTVTLVCSPQFSDAPAVTNGKICLDIAMQDQTDVPFLVYGVLPSAASADITDAVVEFALATSMYKCNCADLPEGSLTEASVGLVNTVCEIALSDSAEPTVGGSTPGRIVRTAGFTTAVADHRAIFSVALVKTPAAESRSILVTKGGIVSSANFAKTAFEVSKSINAVFMLEPVGNLTGIFTVNSNGKKVYFAKGNLQATYHASSDSYSFDFADDQLDFVGDAKGNTSIDYQNDGSVVDLFGWSTAANNYGICTSSDKNNYSGDFVDWGGALDSNAGWRTLTVPEWNYLINEREANGDKKIGPSCVMTAFNGITGVLIFSDDYSGPATGLAAIPEGCVFLPLAGYRSGSEVTFRTNEGTYWTSTFNPSYGYGSSYASIFVFQDLGASLGSSTRNLGYPVRLVLDK